MRMDKKRMTLRLALAACFLALYYVGAMLAGHEEKADAAPAPTVTVTTIINKTIDLVTGHLTVDPNGSFIMGQYTVLNSLASADLLAQLISSPLGQQIPNLAAQLASIRDQGGANPSNLDFLNASGAATELAYAVEPSQQIGTQTILNTQPYGYNVIVPLLQQTGVAASIVQKPSSVTLTHSPAQVVATTFGGAIGAASTTETPAGTMEFILDAGTTTQTNGGWTVAYQTLGDVTVNVYQVGGVVGRGQSQTSVPVMEGWWLVPGLLAGVGMMVRRRRGMAAKGR